MRVAFKQFEIDLLDELISDKNLLSKFTIEKPGTYALMPMSKIEEKVIDTYPHLYSELESAFIQRGLKLVERNKLDRVFEEINFSKTGLTENSRNEIGSLLNAERLIILTDLNLKPNTNSKLLTDFSFSISCVDSKTGEIIWSENVDHQSSIGKSLTQNVQSAISLFISKLRSRGHI